MSSPDESRHSGAGTEEPPAPNQPRWSLARVVGYTVLAGLVFYGTQTAVAVVMLIRRAVGTPDFDVNAWAATAAADGFLLAVSTIAAAATTVPSLRFLAGRREREPWRFLGFEPASAVTIGKWLLVLAAFIVVSDSLTTVLDRPVVPDFMTEIFATVNPMLLLLALVVAAPLTEEVFFRGFLFGALESRGFPTIIVVVVSSAIWAVIHVQYDWYGIATIFAMGALFGAARARTRSVLPCIVMHGFTNALATAQVAFGT